MGKSLSIAQKIWLSLGILIIGYFVSVLFGFILGRNSEWRLYHVSEHIYTASVHSQTALSAFNDQIRIFNDVVIIGNMGNILESAKKEADEVQSELKNISEMTMLDTKSLNEIRELMTELPQFNTAAVALYAKAGVASDYVFENAGTKSGNMEDEIFKIGQQTNKLRDRLAALSRHFSDELKKELSDVSRKTRHYRYINLMLFFGIVIFAGIAVWLVISRSIVRPLKHVIEDLSDCSGKMLSMSVSGTDISGELAERTSQQASSIEEVSASLEEMSSMTALNAGNADQTRIIVGNALILIHKTDKFMTELMNSMTDISKASRQTSNIVRTIDEIAFQTNLLSLNAAVEAARAGQAGAGFAVVANEVRNLALRSAKAAKNTSELIESNVKKIEAGEQIASDTIQTFKSVAEGAENIKKLIAEVATASDNQASGIEHVNKAIAEMDRVTQHNAATADEAAKASRQMNDRAEQMKSMIDDLTDMVKGHNSRNGKA